MISSFPDTILMYKTQLLSHGPAMIQWIKLKTVQFRLATSKLKSLGRNVTKCIIFIREKLTTLIIKSKN